jgi:hypothetical protein
MTTPYRPSDLPPDQTGAHGGIGGTTGGAHVGGDVTGGQVTQVAGNQYLQQNYQLVSGLPAVPAGRVWSIPPPVRSFTGRAMNS